MSSERWWNDADSGNRSTGLKFCPSATLPTTYLTRTDPRSNMGLQDDKSTITRLNYETA